jgi:hypothetical protein
LTIYKFPIELLAGSNWKTKCFYFFDLQKKNLKNPKKIPNNQSVSVKKNPKKTQKKTQKKIFLWTPLPCGKSKNSKKIPKNVQGTQKVKKTKHPIVLE